MLHVACELFHADAPGVDHVAKKGKLGVFHSDVCATGGSARLTKREYRRNNTPQYLAQPSEHTLLGTIYMASYQTRLITPKLLGLQLTRAKTFPIGVHAWGRN